MGCMLSNNVRGAMVIILMLAVVILLLVIAFNIGYGIDSEVLTENERLINTIVSVINMCIFDSQYGNNLMEEQCDTFDTIRNTHYKGMLIDGSEVILDIMKNNNKYAVDNIVQ